MRLRHVSFPLSAAISVAIVAIFLIFGLNYGVDFKGGTLIEMVPKASSERTPVGGLREKANGFGYGEVEVQEFGTNGGVSMRFPIQPGGEAAQGVVIEKARSEFGQVYNFERVETVGPRVSGELVQSGTIGVILSVLAVLAYLWFRFERELAIAAIVGTLHDIVLTIGFYVITRHEFNMTSIAAILTIVGYSLNETVVVFDR
ncbi:protein translocase subunit SecF, partial [uncultured Enterovirga sp.]|uniref:protein translocase subunit SecF n=1 Tax=uncultured Enterovirga sp. TaxID=2026352 RepID=UPI0035CA8A99